MTDALNGPDAQGWKESLQKERDSIESAGTWDLVDKDELPANCKPIDSRLVLATEIDPSGGNNHKLKTRLCAKGFTQRHGIEYFETFSPVGHRQSFRLLLSIPASLNLELKGLDVTTAFLHGPLDETIYMRLPPEVEMGKGKVAKLKKALYGLKQCHHLYHPYSLFQILKKSQQQNIYHIASSLALCNTYPPCLDPILLSRSTACHLSSLPGPKSTMRYAKVLSDTLLGHESTESD